MSKQLYKWAREKQYTNYGPFEVDDVFDPGERGIHLDIVANWEKDGWCEKVKPKRKISAKNDLEPLTKPLKVKKSTKKVKANERYRKKTE